MCTVLYPFMGISISIHGEWGSQSGNVDLSDRLVGRAIPICTTLCSQNGSVHCAILMNRKIYSHSWRLEFPKWNLKVDMSNMWAGRVTPTFRTLCSQNGSTTTQEWDCACILYSGNFLWGPNFIQFILSLSERKFNTRNVHFDGRVFLCKWTERKLNTWNSWR